MFKKNRTPLSPSSEPKKETLGFFLDAKSWYQEKYESVEVSRNQYRLFTFGLLVLLGLSILTTLFLLPLKKDVYRLIEVNKTTGEIDALKEVNANDFQNNWVVTRYFIDQYVLARESYNWDNLLYPYNAALAMTAPRIADSYKKHMHDTDPTSPINILGKNKFRTVTVLGISRLSNDTALVRFDTVITDKVSNEAKNEAWNVVVKWRYSHLNETIKDRDKNPLGFQVTYYQVNPVLAPN